MRLGERCTVADLHARPRHRRGRSAWAAALTGANPIAASVAAALRYEKASYRPQVRGATLAIEDPGRGPQAKFSCGRRVWQRTVVVYVLDRAMLPAESAAQRVYFVGRFHSGYRVWQVVH